MVILVGNGRGELSSNPGRDNWLFLLHWYIWETILLLAMSKLWSRLSSINLILENENTEFKAAKFLVQSTGTVEYANCTFAEE